MGISLIDSRAFAGEILLLKGFEGHQEKKKE